MKAHPAADLFPLLEGAELQALADDIKANGLRFPVVLWRGQIVDGRNRWRACELAGVAPEAVEQEFEDDAAVVRFVVSANLKRRHLKTGQRAMIADALATLAAHRPAGSAENCALSQPAAAELFDVSVKSVQQARAVREHGAPELAAAVEAGDMAVSTAAAVAELPAEEQVAVVEAVKRGDKKIAQKAKAKGKRKKAAKKATRAAAVRAAVEQAAPQAAARYQLVVADVSAGLPEIDDASVDCIVTDPPYPQEHLPLFADLAKLAARVLRPGGSCVVMVGQSYLPAVIAMLAECLDYQWTFAYLTPGGQAAQLWNHKVNSFWKPVLWFSKGRPNRRSWSGDVLKSDPNDNDKSRHHWGQSESGMARIIEAFAEPGQVVLDPFMGGGTTGAVALSYGCTFIGADVDPDAVATSAARLAVVEVAG